MALVVDIVTTGSIPGGISAVATVEQPQVSTGEELVVSVLTANAVINPPVLLLDLRLEPSTLVANATVNAPLVVIIEGDIIKPTILEATAVVNQPTLSLSSTVIVGALEANAEINEPSISAGGSISVQELEAVATLNAPVHIITITPEVLNAFAVAIDPRVIGDIEASKGHITVCHSLETSVVICHE